MEDGSDSAKLEIPKRPRDINGDDKDASPQSKRARKQSACQRCRSRKQGCDSIFPKCKNCQKAKTECKRPPESFKENHGSNNSLRERIVDLESRLATYEKSTPTDHIGADGLAGIDQRLSPSLDSETLESPYATTRQSTTPARQNDIADIVGFLSLGAEPTYIGPSSGISMAANLSEIVQATVWNKILASAAVSEKAGETMSFAEMRRNSASPPADIIGSKILEAYLHRVHPRYPFLIRKELYQLHQDRHRIPTTTQHQFGHFKLYMVYAIGSTMLKLTEPYDATPPEKFFMTALQYISAARDSHSVSNVMAMTLLVIYHLRSSSHTGIWFMIGLAMRTCLDLGLHREAHYARIDPFSAEVKRRLFWSVYTLERVLAVALGRPVSITDRDIDVLLPLDIDDTIMNSSEILVAASRQRPNPQNQATSHPSLKPKPLPQPEPSAITVSIHLTRLYQHESRILSTIYRVDVLPRTLIPEIPSLLSLLADWKTRIPRPILPADTSYLILQYHKAVRLLLQPFLPLLPTSSPYYTTCLNSSGQICQIFKKMHAVEAYGHSFVAVHSTFVAGVTICYCLWLSPHLWSFATSNSLRACSSVLHVIAERTNTVRKYRDVFEELIDATMDCMERKRKDVATMKMPMGLGGSSSSGGRFNWLWRDDSDTQSLSASGGFHFGSGTTGEGLDPFDNWDDLEDLDAPFEKLRRTQAWETFAEGLSGTTDVNTTPLAMGDGDAGAFSLNHTSTINPAGVSSYSSGFDLPEVSLVQGEDAEVGRMLMAMTNGGSSIVTGTGAAGGFDELQDDDSIIHDGISQGLDTGCGTKWDHILGH